MTENSDNERRTAPLTSRRSRGGGLSVNATATALLALSSCAVAARAKLADRSRVVAARRASGRYDRHRDNGRPIEGPAYRVAKRDDLLDAADERAADYAGRQYGTGGVASPHLSGDRYGRQAQRQKQALAAEADAAATTAANSGNGENRSGKPGDARMLNLRGSSSSTGGTASTSTNAESAASASPHATLNSNVLDDTPDEFARRLSSQLTSCCTAYQAYYAADMCGLYGEDCQQAQGGSHDSGDGDCEMDGLSFIGVSFSVNVAEGNPYSYQLCDQFPMQNIIDRDYDYVMSMDEDGWLVGGGYKQFDYSGKMPYIDSSHTELLRVGSLDPNYG